MKALILIIVFLFSGCTSLSPVELSPQVLQAKIATGEILQPGDRIKLVTVDGLHHEFRVTAISETSIEGTDINIPLEQIVALESRNFSGGKTALLAGSALVFYQLLAAIAIVATVGL